MPQEFYSNGKLLLSGEYLVLDGAKAWAMPTKFGQYLQVKQNDHGHLYWKSFDDKGLLWFEGVYELNGFTVRSSSDQGISKTLLKILSEAKKLNPGVLNDSRGLDIETKLTFPRNWGLGSSSTLINNIAQWTKVDAYDLIWNAFSGSGYDIACAKTDSPIIYQLENGIPRVMEIDGKPSFLNSIFFVYLNKKRNSRDAIQAYRQREFDKPFLVKQVSQITSELSTCSHLEEFNRLVDLHEALLSKALGIPTIKEELFFDYKGSIKSLGAWGGDFILATGNEKSMAYFRKKGYGTMLSFQEMIL